MAFIGTDEDGTPFIQRGDYQLKLDLSDLDEHFKLKAREELRETPENIEEGLRKLIELIEEEPDLCIPLDDEGFLLKFLRQGKFDPNKTFRLMQKYYKFIQKNPKYCSDLVPATVAQAFASEVFEFMPLRYKGTRIMIVDVGNWNPKEVNINILFKAIIIMIEIAMLEPRTQVSGVHVILDLQGLSMTHALQITPNFAKTIVEAIENCLPLRLHGIYVINQPYIFNVVYAVFKRFMGEKLRAMLYFLGTKWDNLSQHIEVDFLPKKFGGNLDLPDAPGHLFNEMLLKYEGEFQKLLEIGYVKQKTEII